MKMINYTLPEFCFLDGESHEGNSLEGRTVIQHIRTYTIMEVVALDEIVSHDFNAAQYQFEYTNRFGVTEKHLLVNHFTMADPDSLDEVFQKTADWYRQYLAWEDQNIVDDLTTPLN